MERTLERTQVDVVDVPRGVGVEGFLLTVKELLKVPRIQQLTISPQGKVHVTRLLQDNDPAPPIELDLETLKPSAVIRNCERVKEIRPGTTPWETVAKLFRAASRDRLYPIALVGGASSHFRTWFATTGFDFEDDEQFFGLTLFTDRYIDDDQLYLCAAMSRGGGLLDTVRAYKILMGSTP